MRCTRSLSLMSTAVLLFAFCGCTAVAPKDDREAGFGVQGAVTGIDLRLMRDYRIEGRRVGIVMADWVYCYPPTREVILVPRGYMTDFASIPPSARPLIDVFGDNAEAAVAHDWLYAVGEPGLRANADDLFRFALKEQGVNVITRNAMHRAVRVGGAGAYGRSGEWYRRFGDPDTGQPLTVAPFQKRSSAVVTTVASCEALESVTELSRLRAAHGSHHWQTSQQ